jgi:hypothetical protein
MNTARAFEQAARETAKALVHICRNFSEAKAYLQGAGQYHDRDQFPFPRVVVASLVPGADSAIQFLTWLNQSVENTLILFVFTRSPSAAHRLQAVELGARLFEKPDSTDALQVIVRQIVLAAQTADVRAAKAK